MPANGRQAVLGRRSFYLLMKFFHITINIRETSETRGADKPVLKASVLSVSAPVFAGFYV